MKNMTTRTRNISAKSRNSCAPSWTLGRNNKGRTVRLNPAYSQVVPQRWVDDDPEGWEKAKVGSRRFTQYQWGIPGESFTSEAEARSWVASHFVQPADQNT